MIESTQIDSRQSLQRTTTRPDSAPPSSQMSLTAAFDIAAKDALDGLAVLGEKATAMNRELGFGISAQISDKASLLDTVGERLTNGSNLALRGGLQTANAFFGVSDLLEQFSAEHRSGATQYQKTLKQAAVSVLQSSVNTGIAVGATAAVGALGVLGAPAIVLGAGVAIGASFFTSAAINALTR